MPNLHDTCQRYLQHKHPEAMGAFLYGSAKEGRLSAYSDIDLVVVYEEPVAIYREKARWDGSLFDTFVYDGEALHGAMVIARNNGNAVLAQSIRNADILGVSMLHAVPALEKIRGIAARLANAPPLARSLQNQRQLLTSMLDDLRAIDAARDRVFVLTDVFQCLIDIVMSKYGEMGGTKRYAARLLADKDPQLLEMLADSYREAVNGDAQRLLHIAQATLAIAGGELREGFRMKLPESLRIPLD